MSSAPLLSARLGVPVFLKREDQQETFSFKLRGAYNKIAAMSAAARSRGVITASAGNHAQGVVLAAARLGVRSIIVMPETAPAVKIDAVRRMGGVHSQLVLRGASYSDAQAEAERLQANHGHAFVHPFDDVDVIAGQATVGLELLAQMHSPIDAVFVPVGGGGLLAGVSNSIKARNPKIKVIGVQIGDSDAMARSLEAGRLIALDTVGTFSDGTAVKRPGELTFELCRGRVDGMMRVSSSAVCDAIRDIYQETRCIPEPAGALALAGLKAYAVSGEQRSGGLIAIVSGANMDFSRLSSIAERVEKPPQLDRALGVSLEPLASALTATLADPQPKVC